MESGKRIHCWIVRTADTGAVAVREDARRRQAADPFIADLISKLQAEVREERRSTSARASWHNGLGRFGRCPDGEHAEAEITWSGSPLYFTETDFDGWERRSLPGCER
jgi:hypothetical protein